MTISLPFSPLVAEILSAVVGLSLGWVYLKVRDR